MSTDTSSQNKEDAKSFAELIGPTDPKVDAIVRDKLIGARINLLLNCSFFGNMATRLRLVNADEWCPTAATDGRHFYYNSRFIQLLKPEELPFLFGHEVLIQHVRILTVFLHEMTTVVVHPQHVAVRGDLRMELHGEIPRVPGDFRDLDELAVGRTSRDLHAVLEQRRLVQAVELVPVPVPFMDDLVAVEPEGERIRREPAGVAAEPHRAALLLDLALVRHSYRTDVAEEFAVVADDGLGGGGLNHVAPRDVLHVLPGACPDTAGCAVPVCRIGWTC